MKTYVTGVTIYSKSRGLRNLPIAQAVEFVDNNADDVVVILGAMRGGHLGREVITRDDLARWDAEDMAAAEWDAVAAGERFDADAVA